MIVAVGAPYTKDRPHETATLADYQRLLSGACVKLHATWRGRSDAHLRDEA